MINRYYFYMYSYHIIIFKTQQTIAEPEILLRMGVVIK
jgi:hypothetical protein